MRIVFFYLHFTLIFVLIDEYHQDVNPERSERLIFILECLFKMKLLLLLLVEHVVIQFDVVLVHDF